MVRPRLLIDNLQFIMKILVEEMYRRPRTRWIDMVVDMLQDRPEHILLYDKVSKEEKERAFDGNDDF